MQDWQKRHYAAVMAPADADEQRIVQRMQMVMLLAAAVEDAERLDNVFGSRVSEEMASDLIDAMEKVAGTAIELLNGSTGRLDPGLVDRGVREVVNDAGGDGDNI